MLDINGKVLNWTTGGGNVHGRRASTLIGNGGRINWDGGYSGGWVTYPSDLRGSTTNTFNGTFHLRHGTLHPGRPRAWRRCRATLRWAAWTVGMNRFWSGSAPTNCRKPLRSSPCPISRIPRNRRATLQLWGNTDTVGTLTVQTETIVDLGGGKDKPGAICFADSSGKPWDLTKTLTIKGAGTVRFGKSANGLTPAQLAIITFETLRAR